MTNLANNLVTDTELIQNFYKMFEKREIELIRNQLPSRYREMICEKTGLSIPTVARFFGFNPIRQHNAELIYDAALELIQQGQERLDARKKKMKKLMAKGAQQNLNL